MVMGSAFKETGRAIQLSILLFNVFIVGIFNILISGIRPI
jgi:hypothetical protein